MALNHSHQQKKNLLLLLTRSNKKGRSSTTIDNDTIIVNSSWTPPLTIIDSKIQLKQQSLTEIFSAKQQWDGSSKQAESANRAVATYIACLRSQAILCGRKQ